jgi:hypothetical protein
MSLMEIRRGLLREVGATGNVRVFDEASARHAALAACASAAGVHAALKNRDESTFAVRERILCALVAEQQRAPRALWLALLGLAFEPMLGRLERDARSWVPERDEREALLLASFADAVQKVGASSGVATRLQWRTRRLVVRAARAQLAYRARVCALIDEPTTGDDVSPEQLVVEKNLVDRARVHRAWRRRLRRRRGRAVERPRAPSFRPNSTAA